MTVPPIGGTDFLTCYQHRCVLSVKLFVYYLGFSLSKHSYILLLASMLLLVIFQRILKDGYDGFGIVVSGDAVNGQGAAFNTFVDQHQFASRLKPVLVPALLQGQPDGFHLSLACGQPVTCREQVKVA